MIYYTSLEQEQIISKPYLEAVKVKERELRKREEKTGKPEKYTAIVYVKTPLRIFKSINKKIFIEINSIDYPCPTEPVSGGSIYKIDFDFEEKYNSWIKLNPDYSITFDIDGKYGKTIYYCGQDNYVYPSIISSLNNKEINETFEDEFKYDIGCL